MKGGLWVDCGWIAGGEPLSAFLLGLAAVGTSPRRKAESGCGWIIPNDDLKANTPHGWVDLCDEGWQFAHARASGRRCEALQGGGRAWASREALALSLITHMRIIFLKLTTT